MGDKGAKLTSDASETADALVDALQSLGEVSSKKMFGGYGIFGDGVMFALVDSSGTPFLRVGDSNQTRFDKASSDKHSRMPYFSIPPAIFGDQSKLEEWAADSLEIAKNAKK